MKKILLKCLIYLIVWIGIGFGFFMEQIGHGALSLIAYIPAAITLAFLVETNKYITHD